MEIEYPTVQIPATPDYVLNVLLERARLECNVWSFSPSEKIGISLDSSIESLYKACDFDCFDVIFYSTLEWFDLRNSD
ncbi:MAG: hypothetical protein QM501_01350 [Gimesia sp.]